MDLRNSIFEISASGPAGDLPVRRRQHRGRARWTAVLLGLCLLGAVGLGAGCTGGARPVDEQVADSTLASTLRERLEADRALRGQTIDVSVLRGTVTLTGRVSNRDQRQRAEGIAEDLEGVREVRNLIRVPSGGAAP